MMKRVLLLIALVFTFNTLFAQKALKILRNDGSITYINASAINKITLETPLAIGDTYEGGIIFYLDANGEHGLVAAPNEQFNGDGISWSTTNTTTGATGDGVGAGEENTNTIVRELSWGGQAAYLCSSLTLGGYSDWYLPSKYELNLMYTNLAQQGFGNFDNRTAYWSSTEESSTEAWLVGFGDPGGPGYYLKSGQFNVRAVRAF